MTPQAVSNTAGQRGLRIKLVLRGLFRDNAGVIALQTALAATTLFGIAGVSVDAAQWYYSHRAMQSAADAAAIAGARELAAGLQDGDATAAARVDAGLNGYGSTVAAMNLTFGASPQAVTVTLGKAADLFLSRVVVSNPPTIQATATATLVNNGPPVCLLATSSNAAGALGVNGNAAINAAGCSVVSNSNSPQSISGSGNASITSDKTCTPGGVSITDNVALNPPPSGCAAVPDPFADVAAPPNENAPCDFSNVPAITGSATLSPGVYCGGVSISGNANVVFQPGVYVMRNGGLSASGNAVVNGAGVAFYLTENSTVHLNQDDLSLSGNTTIHLSAPQSGPLAGFVVYQRDPGANPGDITSSISGNGNTTYDGTLYFGNQNVSIDGNGASSSNQPFTAVVANQITVSGNGVIDFSHAANPPPGLQLSSVVLTQ